MKFRNIKYKLLPVAFGVLLATSCNKDDLDPVPRTTISDAIAFSTPERILAQVNGMYQGMKDGRFLGGRGFVYMDIRAEEWLNVTTNGVTGFSTWNHSVSSTTEEVKNFWSFGYTAINRINVVLDGIAANPGVISAELANQYTAEGRFIRAVAYYYLVNLYGKKPFTADNGASPGLPLRLTGQKTPNEAHLARSTVAEVYAQILDDLNFAEANLSTNVGAGDLNVVRAQKNAAIAMKTRVYLSMGRYSDVITEANKLVPAAPPFIAPSGVPHRLVTPFTTAFRAPYTSVENIFSFPMTNTSNPGTQNGLALYHNNEYELNPSAIVNDPSFTANDARKALVTVAGGRMRYTKFNSDNDNFVPILRYAEVMLNLAEALVRANNTVDARAVALLNSIRQRSDASVTFTVADFATSTDLLNAILRERRMEFLGEGQRNLDIMRQYIAIPGKGTVPAVPTTTTAYVWPIPQDELLYNNLMTTNE